MASEDYHNIAHQTTLMDFLFFLELTHFCLKVKKAAWAILLITWNSSNK